MSVQTDLQTAVDHNQTGLSFYDTWNIDRAIAAFQQAIATDSTNGEYRLNLARAYARGGDYHQAVETIGEYLHYETNDAVAARFESLFSLALDEVEQVMIETMRELGLSIQQIGKGIQMWLEYRITYGRRVLRVPKPEIWAAAITYAILKVNLVEVERGDLTAVYNISDRALREKYKELVQTLDLMPADYRYFTEGENPLDKLVEAAQMLEELDRRFQEY
ncbi:MAG: tetratricopeptide repeat protein [Anaerolineales bacterium]|nr:tetratricopeptide repeat protein [Anaerolineales bacterium]